MLSKSSLLKLKGDFVKLGLSQDEVAAAVGSNKMRLHQIYNGKYDGPLVKKLVSLRNAKREEARQIEKEILQRA